MNLFPFREKEDLNSYKKNQYNLHEASLIFLYYK
jgi:hypothetical protein